METSEIGKLTRRKQSLFAIGVIFLSAGLLFLPFLISGRVLAPFDIVHQMFLPWRGETKIPKVHNHFVTDAVTQYIPYRMFAEKSYREDGYIGWNSNLFGGTAQYADTMGLYFDWTMHLHRFLSFWNAWHLGLYLQFIIAGTGMFLFLRACAISPPIALMSALAYMTNWQFVAWVYHRWALGSFCWLPFALWAMSPWLGLRQSAGDQEARTSLRFAITPIFVALSFMGGTLQHCAFVVIACICVFLGGWWDGPRRPKFFFTQFGNFLAWGILAVALSGFMFDPTIRAYMENNATGHVRGILGYDAGWDQPILNAFSYPFYLFPFLLGSPNSLDFWKVFSSDMFNVGFFGTVPMVLALLAIFRRSVPSAAKLLILAGLFIPLTPLVGLLYHRVNLLWILGGCWAAAELLQRSSPTELLSTSRKIVWCLTLFGGIWLFGGSFFRAINNHIIDLLTAEVLLRAESSQFGYFRDWIILRTQRASDWILLTNPFQYSALGLALISGWALRIIKKTGTWTLAPALAVFLQTSLFWWIWTTWSDPSSGYNLANPSPIITSLHDAPRLAQECGSVALTPFPPNTMGGQGVAITGGYDSIHPQRMKGTTDQPWDFPGTTHYLAPIGSPAPSQWEVLDRSAETLLFKNPDPDPIFSANESRTSENPSEKTVPIRLVPVLHTSNRVLLDIPAKTSEVHILENWHRGWYFRLGEEPWQKVTMADNRSMVIPLSAQPIPRRLTIQFFCFSSMIGPAASVLGTLVIVFIATWGRVNRKTLSI